MQARAAEEARREAERRARWRERQRQGKQEEARQRQLKQERRQRHAEQRAHAQHEERHAERAGRTEAARRDGSAFHRPGFEVGAGGAGAPATGFKLPLLSDPCWRSGPASARTLATTAQAPGSARCSPRSQRLHYPLSLRAPDLASPRGLSHA